MWTGADSRVGQWRRTLTAATIDGDDQPRVGGVAGRALREAQQLPQAGPRATGWVTAAGSGRRRRPPAGVGVLPHGVPTTRPHREPSVVRWVAA